MFNADDVRIVRAELQMLVLIEDIDSGLDVQPRIPGVNFVVGHADHQCRIDPVPLALIGNGAVKKRCIGRPVQEAEAGTDVGDQQQALICVPRL